MRRRATMATGLALAAVVGCHSGIQKDIHSRNDAALRDDLQGGDVNEVEGQGYTPLIYAAREGNLPACRILLDRGAKVNAADGKGSTALMYAADDNHLEIAQLLLDHGADVNAANNRGNTALGYATGSNHAAVADLLRSHGGH